MNKILLTLFPIFLMAGELTLSSVLVADGFKKPLFITSYPTDSNLLYVVEQAGRIMLINNGQKLNQPFLDINKQVVDPSRPGDERGLLGFALHPDFLNNGKFYVNYMNNDGFTVLSEFSTKTREKADPSSERIIFDLKQPYRNHNGGHLEFGPDEYLYISIGDGGKAGDPLKAGQDLNTLFGKIIRIDVNKTPYGIPKSNPFYGQKISVVKSGHGD